MFGIPLVILSNLPAILGGVEAAWNAITSARSAAHQAKAWTETEEKEFADLQAHLFSLPHWQVENNSPANPTPAPAPAPAPVVPPATA